MGEVPLMSGEYVTEAAIVDLFNAYKGEVARVNALRPKDRRIHGMRYQSFYTMYRFAQLLGLVEHVRDEPMLFPPPRGTLIRIEKENTEARIRTSDRKIFRLSELGRADERSWSDLTTAWKEQWTRPQPIEYIPPIQVPPTEPAPPKPKPVRKPVEKPTTFSPYVWKETPSRANFRSLLRHLYILKELGIDSPGVGDEVERLSMSLGDWIIDTEDKIEEARSINYRAGVEENTRKLNSLNTLAEALGEGDLDAATPALEELVSGT